MIGAKSKVKLKKVMNVRRHILWELFILNGKKEKNQDEQAVQFL